MSLYDRVAATPEGARALAKARLRTRVLEALWEAIEACGGEDEFRRRTGVSRRRLHRVSTERRNLTIDVLAEWLHAAGFELEIRLVPAGQPRADVLAKRAVALGDRSIAIGGSVSGSVTTGDSAAAD